MCLLQALRQEASKVWRFVTENRLPPFDKSLNPIFRETLQNVI